jgi:broad specificity phosphatase PhoE
LPRTQQTAELLNINNKEIIYIDDLKEIITYPPKFFFLKRLPIIVWIYICIFSCLFDGNLFRVIKETKELYKTLLSGKDDIIVVSHAMRIRSFIYYAYFCPSLRVRVKDFTPCGVTIVERRNKKEALQATPV